VLTSHLKSLLWHYNRCILVVIFSRIFSYQVRIPIVFLGSHPDYSGNCCTVVCFGCCCPDSYSLAD